MKKTVALISMMLLVGTAVFAQNYKNGVYFAQETEYPKSGWKYNVTLVVKGGKIADVMWNASNINGGPTKDEVSRAGKYGMVEKGNAIAPWWKQAEAVEKALVRFQTVDKIRISDAAGHTDAVSGATIKVQGFVDLVKKALKAGPVGYGPYKDGAYRAEMPAFDHGYKYFVDVTITSGYIVSVSWDALAEGGGKNKNQASMDGDYGMVAKGGAMAPWFEQANAVEAYALNAQDADMPDAISGATIGLDPFYELLKKALAKAAK